MSRPNWDSHRSQGQFQSKNHSCDKNLENAKNIAKIMTETEFDTEPNAYSISDRKSILKLIKEGQKYGEIATLVNSAGVSPS